MQNIFAKFEVVESIRKKLHKISLKKVIGRKLLHIVIKVKILNFFITLYNFSLQFFQRIRNQSVWNSAFYDSHIDFKKGQNQCTLLHSLALPLHSQAQGERRPLPVIPDLQLGSSCQGKVHICWPLFPI